MGRPGAGGGGSSRSSGGRSMSRSSGGHRIGSSSSSSRPRGGSYSRPSGGGYNPPPRPPRQPHYGGGYGYGGPRHYGRTRTVYKRTGCVESLTSIVILLIFIVVLFSMLGFWSCSGPRNGSTNIPSSSYNREKLNAGGGYYNDCIYDELGWFDNESRTESRLKDFYDETGVQPYIAILDYIPGVDTDSEKEAYANEFYEKNIDNEATFLYVYFAEPNEGASDIPGYMCYVNGYQVSSVMDSEAVSIFWAYLDSYWYSNMSTDDMFVKTFNSTADRIMTKSTTSKDITKYLIIAVIAGVGVFGVIKVVKLKHQRAKEEAEETERILNTPMEQLVEDELKETAKKYDN